MTTRIPPRGFTLIEMMIAIFIGLIIFTIGFTAISSTIQARRESEAKVRATENARLFFDLLQKDLASAYPIDSVNSNLPTMAVETPNQPIVVNNKPIAVTNDRIEFFVRADHRGSTDQFIFVRYFINNLGHLCRQTFQSTTTAADALTLANPIDLNNDDSALFDQAFSILVSPCQWQDTAKNMAVGTAPPCSTSTTHLRVSLFLFGYTGVNLAVDNLAQTKRVFVKTLEVPDVFRQLP